MTPARPHTWAAVHAATLAAGVLALAYLGRGAWFFYDEWDIVGNHSLSLFQPHNEHWSTLPYLVYGALYPVFGLREYLPYLLVVIALHAGVAHLLWRLLRAEGVSDPVATALAAAFLVFGPGAENLDWAWQMGFVGSVLFGFLAVLLAATGEASSRRDAVAGVALIAGLMCSGIGVTMVAVTGMAVCVRRGWRAAMTILVVPTLVFVAWYAAAGHAVSRTYARPTLPQVVNFVGEGLASTAELGHDIPFIGPALVLFAVAWAGWHLPGRSRRHPVAMAGILGALVLFILVSLGRLQYGPEAATQGRYVYVAAALLVPVGGLALHWLSRHGLPGVAVSGGLLLLVLVHNSAVLVNHEHDHGAISAVTRRLVIDAAAGPATSASIRHQPGERPDPTNAPTLTIGRIGGFVRDGAMPSG